MNKLCDKICRIKNESEREKELLREEKRDPGKGKGMEMGRWERRESCRCCSTLKLIGSPTADRHRHGQGRKGKDRAMQPRERNIRSGKTMNTLDLDIREVA